MTTPPPTLVALSLGAGIQSTTLALMAVEGVLPKPDVAIFADTKWEPAAVYAHLDKLEVVLATAGIPLLKVSNGNLREDAIDPTHRYASVPYFVRNAPYMVRVVNVLGADPCGGCDESSGLTKADPEADPETCTTCGGSGRLGTTWKERPATLTEREGMGRRQCTSEYKLSPIRRKVRELLGAKPPEFRTVPKGQVCEQWVGFSTDEIGRVSDGRNSVRYLTTRYPLLDLGMSRKDCERWLTSRGWTSVEKSACVGCPFHGNRQWRELRDNRPEEWADAVAFDQAIRKGGSRGLPLNGEAFLHRSRVPLDLAPIDRVTRPEWADRQVDLLDLIAEEGDPDGCSPYGCRSGSAVTVDADDETRVVA